MFIEIADGQNKALEDQSIQNKYMKFGRVRIYMLCTLEIANNWNTIFLDLKDRIHWV